MFSRVAVVIAAGVTMLVAACAIQLRGDNDETASNPAAPQSTGTLEPSLTRCRTVRPEQTASYDYCRRIWAENRRRFSVRREVRWLPLAVMRSPANRPSCRQRIRAGCRKVTHARQNV